MKSITDNTEQNYNTKQSGQSSTSSYIQGSVTNADGTTTTKAYNNTPDDKIVNTNLKKTFCETISFKVQTFLGIPIPLPFLKTKSKDEIKEVPLDKEKLQYGKTLVNETAGGFVELKSQTPKNKIWQWLHPAGTYRKIVDDGTLYDKVISDAFIIVNKNWNISVGKDFIEVVEGNNKIQIKKNTNTNINGDSSMNIDGNSNTNVVKDCGLQVQGNSVESISKNKTVDITGTLKETISKDHSVQVNGSETNTIIKDRTDVVCGGLNILVTGNINLSSKGTVNIIGKKINLG